MSKPPKDFKGNQQDWNAIEELNSPEYESVIDRSFRKILDKHKEKIHNLNDGSVFNLNDTDINRAYDIGVDNKMKAYVWDDKAKEWIS